MSDGRRPADQGGVEEPVPSMAGRACVIRYQPFSDPDGRREAEALASTGLDVTLLCLRRSGEPSRSTVNGVEVRRVKLPKQRGGVGAYVVDYGLWFLYCLIWVSYEHLRRPFRVIQVTSLPDFQVFATVVARATGSTIVLFLKEPAAELVESTNGPAVLARLMRVVSRRAIRFADLTFTVTEQHRALYLKSGSCPEDLFVIENTPPQELLGVSRAERCPGAGFMILCHGTIEQRYGHDTILDAASILRERGVQVQFVITGSGTWAGHLKDRIQAEELGSIVSYRGFVSADELGGLLLTASAGIVAQHDSPYSNVVHTQKMYEYFSLGIPVIASRLAATADYFESAIEFFTAGDAGDLADRIECLRADESRRDERVAAADVEYERLSWPRLRLRYLHAIAGRTP